MLHPAIRLRPHRSVVRRNSTAVCGPAVASSLSSSCFTVSLAMNQTKMDCGLAVKELKERTVLCSLVVCLPIIFVYSFLII